MPAMKRHKTRYPGVVYVTGTAPTGKPDQIFYIRYRRGGRAVEEKAGSSFKDDMSAARANQLRARRMAGDQPNNRERREADKAAKEAEAGRWTIQKLADEYFAQRRDGKALFVDRNRFELYLAVAFGSKEPAEVDALSVDRLRKNLEKRKSKQTVKHVLNLLAWVVSFGRKRGLCDGLRFHITRPEVNNTKTEFLTDGELRNLLAALDRSENVQVANMVRLALYTGMRRGELFKLTWSDIDMQRGFIAIRDPKGGKPQAIPMNGSARDIIQNHPRTPGSDFVFPGIGGRQRTGVNAALRKIRLEAGLPDDFRMLHGMRHQYASMLASSGQVDLYTIQKLLTHKSPAMTMRYSHLRDEALRKASNLAGDLVRQALEAAAKKEDVKEEIEK